MTVSTLEIEGPTRLRGHVHVPPDKSITHRALILAAMGKGDCRVEPAGHGEDNRSTAAVLASLGVPIRQTDHGYHVQGVGGPEGLTPCASPLDCGNSGTTMRLMAGILAAAQGSFVLDGDASLRKRPMARLAPLEAMGAKLRPVHAATEEEGSTLRPPIVVDGGRLRGANHALAIASAQVKSALLLAGLFAEGPTRVREPGRSRDHTERMLRALGVQLDEASDGTLTVWPRAEPWRAPVLGAAPDLSSAAFWLGAAALTGSTDLVVRTGVNPTRAGVLDALQAFGVQVRRVDRDDVSGEPVADLSVSGRPERPVVFRGDLTLRSIDELPLLAAVASAAPGETRIHDAGELRVKETDRVQATVDLLTAFGVPAAPRTDGLVVTGGAPLRAATLDAGHDHRIAMTAAVLALAAPGRTIIRGADIIAVSYPGFADALRQHGARVRIA